MKTVKVRIAVAVDPTGAWNAVGWCGALGEAYNPKTAAEFPLLASEHVAEGEALYWLTAELPIPEPTEVGAEVEPVNP